MIAGRVRDGWGVVVHTYGSALGLVGVSVPGHLAAEAEVPILSGPQCQGDVMVIPLSGPGGRR
jgi:hypothetical protein